MLNKKPFFSIVLPTLNRAHYLPLAVQSVLNQHYEDFELIISDNCSLDNTEQVVRTIDDSRIRYFKTNKVLSLGKSWAFALSHAVGEYITFLGDDDAYSSIYLSSLEKIIRERRNAEVVACKICNYYYFDFFESGRKMPGNSLLLQPFTGKLYAYENRQAVKHWFKMAGLSQSQINEPCDMPMLINAAYRNSLISKIENRLSSSFMPTILCNDLYTAVTSLSFTDKYYYLDSPLSLHGFSKGSTTQFTNAQELCEYFEKFSADTQMIHSPLKFLSFNSIRAEAFLQAKADLGDKLDFLELDWKQYYQICYLDLLSISVIGVDVSEQLKEFFAVLEREDEELARQLTSKTATLKIKAKQILRKRLRTSTLANLLRTFQHRKQKLITGEKAGFKDISECARMMDETFLAQYETARLMHDVTKV